MEDTSIQSKGSTQRTSGIVLIGLLLVLLLVAVYDVVVGPSIDFPL
jgi:hypothetical protein